VGPSSVSGREAAEPVGGVDVESLDDEEGPAAVDNDPFHGIGEVWSVAPGAIESLDGEKPGVHAKAVFG
jgi:hypothetical protein